MFSVIGGLFGLFGKEVSAVPAKVIPKKVPVVEIKTVAAAAPVFSAELDANDLFDEVFGEDEEARLEPLAKEFEKTHQQTLLRTSICRLHTARKQRTALRAAITKKREDALRRLQAPETFEEAVTRLGPKVIEITKTWDSRYFTGEYVLGPEDFKTLIELSYEAQAIERSLEQVRGKKTLSDLLEGQKTELEEKIKVFADYNSPERVDARALIDRRKKTFAEQVAWLEPNATEIIDRCFSESRDGYQDFNFLSLDELVIDQFRKEDIEPKLQQLERLNLCHRIIREKKLPPETAQHLEEWVKAHPSALTTDILKRWVSVRLKQRTEPFVPKILNEFITLREKFIKAVEKISLKGVVPVLENFKAVQGGDDDAVDAMKAIQGNLSQFKPLFMQYVEKTSNADAETQDAFIRFTQFPTRIELLCKEFLRELQSEEHRLVAAQTVYAVQSSLREWNEELKTRSPQPK